MPFSIFGFGSSAQRHELDLEAALVNNSQERRIFGEADDFVRNSSWTDRVKSVASRVLHGEFYKWFYVVISVLSVFALFTSFLHKCDSKLYLTFEFLLNSALIIEISIRIAALQEHFWTSWSNLFDIFVMATCLITLILLPAECSDTELRLDALVLLVRNVFQALRLYAVVQQGRKHSQIRVQPVEFDFDVQPSRTTPFLPSKVFTAQSVQR